MSNQNQFSKYVRLKERISKLPYYAYDGQRMTASNIFNKTILQIFFFNIMLIIPKNHSVIDYRVGYPKNS